MTLIIVARMEVDTSKDLSANLFLSRDNRQSQRIVINTRGDGDTGKQFDDYWLVEFIMECLLLLY